MTVKKFHTVFHCHFIISERLIENIIADWLHSIGLILFSINEQIYKNDIIRRGCTCT